MSEKPRVLFLGSHNAGRTQMAEALLRKHGGHRFDVCSAGLEPSQLHPLATEVLAEVGVTAAGLHAKPITAFLGKTTIAWAIIMCEPSERTSPRLYPFATRTVRWPFEDPTWTQGSAEIQLVRFRRVRDAIDARIRSWLREVEASPEASS
jgi:arsenate reductase